MMKSYQRLVPEKVLGLISSGGNGRGGICFDGSGSLALSCSLQNVNIFNVRMTQQVGTIESADITSSDYPYNLSSDSCVIERFPKELSENGTKPSSRVAVGYCNGDIQIWNYFTRESQATLRGHKSAITCLAFKEHDRSELVAPQMKSDSLHLLASGGKDCDIIIWDLISFKGVCRLRGHKDAVTGIAFIQRVSSLVSSQALLVSVAKDTLIMVWDLSTQHCLQTIVGHRSEIWSLVAINQSFPSHSEPPFQNQWLLITGAADEYLRGYRTKPLTVRPSASNSSSATSSTVDASSQLDDSQEILEYCGCISRAEAVRSLSGGVALTHKAGSGTDRCVSLKLSPTLEGDHETLLAAQTGGKFVEVYKLRSVAETLKKWKRRLKRLREKARDSEEAVGESEEQGDKSNSLETTSWQLQDALEAWDNIRFGSKIKGLAFSPIVEKSKQKTADTALSYSFRLLIGLANNSLELFSVTLSETIGVSRSAQVAVIDASGHRTDVRAVCISDDSQSMVTCSSESVKIWSMRTQLCIGSCLVNASNDDSEDSYCVSCVFAPGGRFALVGTKEGLVKVVDCASLQVVGQVDAGGTVWSLATRPDGSGFIAGCGDKAVKFFDFEVSSVGLHLELARELRTSHEVLCVRFSRSRSANKLLLAAGLLDNTIKVFFDDSLKLFLSLYGHSLPVLSLDFSWDGGLLVSGSADKTIKIWGLDFGDCHRSLLGHGDSVTCIRFQPKTHYFLSAGKDGLVKYWDADRFEQIQFLPGHRGSVWGLDLTSDGAEIVSVGQDKSIRVWSRSEDLVFVEEERERALEAQVDQVAVTNAATQLLTTIAPGSEGTTANGSDPLLVARSSLESIKGAEQVMAAIELVAQEVELEKEAAATGNNTNKRKIKPSSSNPLLLGLSPLQYLLRVMRSIKMPDLEQVLLLLPFSHAMLFFSLLVELVRRGSEIELVARTTLFLLSAHQPQVVARAAQLQGHVRELQLYLSASIDDFRLLTGANCAGLRHLVQLHNEKQLEKIGIIDEQLPGLATHEVSKGKKSKKQKRKID